MSHTVIVEGLIGAGKSSLSTELGAALGPNTLVLLEPDEANGGNSYLSDFYADKTRWAFSMQCHLLATRLRMQLQGQWHAMANYGIAVHDRSYWGDVCFARLMHGTGEISDREFETYRILYQTMTASVLLPTVCVHLQVSPEVSAERIQRRLEQREGRRCEQAISLDYLQALDSEINLMVNTLRGQGVTVLSVPWDADLDTPEKRGHLVGEIAQLIHAVGHTDLFTAHHKRVLL